MWRRRALLALLGVLLLGVAAGAYWRLRAAADAASVLGQENSTWSRSIFFRGYAATAGTPLRLEDIDAYATTMRDNGIKYVYLFSGPFQADGSLPEWATSAVAKASVERMKAIDPGLKVLPWVGGLQGRTVHLDDPAWRGAALDAMARLFDALPIDGMHLDFELIAPPDAYTPGSPVYSLAAAYVVGLKAFHAEARARFPRRFLSSVVVSTASGTTPWKLKHTLADATDLARHVDQLSFLYYDTSIKDPVAYERNLDEQLQHFAAIKDALGAKAPQLLLAIGTFVNEPELQKFRDLTLENIPYTLTLLRRRVDALAPGRRLVDGLAIYCEWQTDADEWRQIREGWTSRGATPPS
jgi:hypothetical protein